MNKLSTLQAEVGEWAKRNFPEATSIQPLIGIAEECGELCHAHLKSMQEIRGSEAEHLAAKKDAIGDMMIFLMHYCSLAGYDGSEAVRRAIRTPPYPNPILELIAAVGFLTRCHFMDMRGMINSALKSLVEEMLAYCLTSQIDFEQTVLQTWAEVRRRDWRKNSKDGS